MRMLMAALVPSVRLQVQVLNMDFSDLVSVASLLGNLGVLPLVNLRCGGGFI